MKNLFLKVLATQKLWLGVLLCCLVCGSGEIYGQSIELNVFMKKIDSLTIMYQKAKEYQKVFIFLEKYRKNIESIDGKNNEKYAYILYRLGYLFQITNEYKKSELFYLQASEILSRVIGKNNEDYISSLNDLGVIYKLQGDFSKSELMFQEALDRMSNLRGNKHLYYSFALNNLADLNFTIGNYAKAKEMYLSSKKIISDTLGNKNIDYAITLNGLASIYYKQKLYNEAKMLYQETEGILSSILPKEHNFYLSLLNNLAMLDEAQGFLFSAEKLHKETLSLKRQKLGNSNISYAISLNNLAQNYSFQNKYDNADSLFKEALNIYQKNVGNLHSSTNMVKNNLAIFYSKQRKYSLTNDIYIEISKNKYTEIYNNFTSLSEIEKKNYLIDNKIYFDNILRFLINTKLINIENHTLIAAFFNLQLSTKGILLHSSQKMKANILASQDSNLVRKFEQWEQQRKQLLDYDKLPLAEKAKNKQLMDSLAEATNNIEKQLSAQSENFATLTDKKKYTWQDIQEALQPNEVAVEMVRVSKFGVEKVLTDSSDTEHFKAKGFYPKYDRYGLTDTTYYAALLISKATKDAPELVVLENGNDLETKHFQYYRDAILSGKGVDLVSYGQFWQKIAASNTFKALQNKPKIYVSLDGMYHKINLHTLYNPQTKTYLSNEIAIQQVSNLKEIITNRNRKITPKKEIILVGYPNYNLPSEKRWVVAEQQQQERAKQTQNSVAQIEVGSTPNNNSTTTTSTGGKRAEKEILDPLKNTEEEILAIAQAAQAQQWQAAVYLDSAALEETVRHANNPRVLHIATHGFFDNTQSNGNVLLNSGLYLAGANLSKNGKETLTIDNILSGKKAEDGILTAAEAMNLSLDQTDLVVLSACETGRGEVSNGEGVYGLQRAFMVSGAKALLCTLWNIDDLASQQFMTAFYAHYFKTNNKREAFKVAQETLQKDKKFSHPYYWGSFVLIGE